MRKYAFSQFALIILLFYSATNPQIVSGIVVTEEMKLWAKQASQKKMDPAYSAAPNKIGVLYFENKTQQHGMNILQKGISVLLTHDLKKIKTVKVISREKVEALLNEKKIKIPELQQTNTAIQIGKLLQVEHVITGQIHKEDKGRYRVVANIYNVRSQTIIDRISSQGNLFSDLRIMEKDLLFKISQVLNIQLNPQEKNSLSHSITKSSDALQYYLQAVTESDQEQYGAANKFYIQSLQADPDCALSSAAIQELSELGLSQASVDIAHGEAEAYSDQEAVAIKPDVEKSGARYDTRDPETWEPDTPIFFNTVVEEPEVEIEDTTDTPLSILHIRTGATWDMAVDSDSLQSAIDDRAEDPSLRELTDNRNTIPGQYDPNGTTYGFPGAWNYGDYGVAEIYGEQNVRLGIQTLGQDGYGGTPKLLINANTLDRINNDGLLAYAIQVEEDRLNKKIIEMHDSQLIQNTLYTAEKFKGIRARDAWLTQKADAQAGRVLKDMNGNWVRIQQYVLRPNAETVQMLNVSLRGGDHNLSGLSTINWTTTFSEAYTGDLRNLPWDNWLNTQETIVGSETVRYVSGPSDDPPPMLKDMDVSFTNPGSESLSNQREFANSYLDSSGDHKQKITGESLQTKTGNTVNTYQIAQNNSPTAGEFGILTNSSATNGFSYMLGNTNDQMDVRFYVVGDGDTMENRGEIPGFENATKFADMWDALRVNESGAPNIGFNNLEIQIDPQMRFYEKPINTIYIPMSRMIWKSESSLNPSP